MKKLLAISIFLTFSGLLQAACQNQINPKKVVLMLAFHNGSEEEKGAIEGACARGEKLVILPKINADKKRLADEVDSIRGQFYGAYERSLQCETDTCRATSEVRIQQLRTRYEEARNRMDSANIEPNLDRDLQAFLQSARADGTQVTSLILSGHDGGGHYYGEYGDTTIGQIGRLATRDPAIFGNVSSLLLMGCWSGVPDQVEQWKYIFPKTRVMGGFVGSAPASTRIAAGTYINGLLRGERNLPTSATRAQVQSMLNQVQHINLVTSGVYVDPNCSPQDRSPAYYFIGSGAEDYDIPANMREGLSTFTPSSGNEPVCRALFGQYGSFDWGKLFLYFNGELELTDNPELRGLYSTLRNNQFCFREGFATAKISPDQVLLMRFYQDTKKNINKYFENDLKTMYRNLEGMVNATRDPQLKAAWNAHSKLYGDSLIGMNRKETVKQISKLQGIFDKAASKLPTNRNLPQIRATMNKIDKYLFRLRCMPATWHEYAEGETLTPPSC